LSASEDGELAAVDFIMRKKILILLGFGYLLCTVTPLRAFSAPADLEKKRQDSLRAVRLEKVAAFRAVYPGVELHANPVTGVPEHLYGDLSKNQTQSEPVEATYEFLEQNKDLYGITNPRDELKVQGVAKDKYGAMVDLKQVYKGVDIYRAGMSVHFNSAGKLKGITGGFAQISDLSTTPSIDFLSAIGIAKRELNYTAEDERRAVEKWGNIPTPQGMKQAKPPVNARLFVVSFKGEYRLVWIVGLRRAETVGTWEYWIDAHTGQILHKANRMRRINSRDRLQRAIFAQAIAGIDKSVFAP
jgi:hypothetical protein